MSRDLDIRIAAARDTGFVIWEASELVAAVANPQELAMYIESRGMQVEGELERMRSELTVVAPASDSGRTFPNILKGGWARR